MRGETMVSILLLALFLRLVNLDQSLWLDEAAQAIESARPFWQQWQIGADFHPPFFHYLVHFWMRGGMGEWYLRLVSVMAGVATVGVVYLIGKEVGGERVGKLSALFLAVAPYHIYYSQELRMYAWSGLWAALAIYFLLKRKWAWHTLVLVGGFYTLYLWWFLVPAEVGWLWLRRRDDLKNYLISLGVAGAAFAPWVGQLMGQLRGGLLVPEAWPEWRALSGVVWWKAGPLTFAKFALGRVSFGNKLIYGGLVGLAGVIFAMLWWRGLVGRDDGEGNWLIGMWLGVPLGVAWAVSFWVPVNGPWRLLFILPAVYILAARGVASCKSLVVSKTLIIGILGVSMVGNLLYWFNPKFQREDWRGAVEFVQGRLNEESVVVFAFPDPVAPYRWYSGDDPRAGGAIEGLVATEGGVDGRLSEMTRGKKKVWRFEYLQGLTDKGGLIPEWLEESGFSEVKGYDFEGVGIVWEYERN